MDRKISDLNPLVFANIPNKKAPRIYSPPDNSLKYTIPIIISTNILVGK